MRKKLFSLFLLVFAGFVLVACNNDKVDLEAVRDETYEAVFKGSDTLTSVTQDLVFKTKSDKHEDIVITWTSSDTNVISNTGVVKRQSEDKKVTISFEVKYNGKTADKTFEVTVKKAEAPAPGEKFSITLPENVTASKDKDIASGTEVTLTITPPNGKVLEKLTVDSEDVTAKVVNNTYKFKVTKNVVVAATFKEEPNIGESVLIYQTGFNTSEGFSVHLDDKGQPQYNNQEEILNGAEGKQFAILSGSPTKSFPLEGDQSVQVRYYSSKPETFGYIRSDFALQNITEIKFNAANSSGNTTGAQNYKILVEVSADGTTWSNGKSYILTGDNTEFSYVNTLETAKYFKFTLQLGEGSHGKNQGFAIDNVRVFGAEDERPSVNVTFDEGYTDAPTKVVPVKVGDTVVKPVQDPVREGYTFVSWVKEGQTEAYDFSQNVEEEFTLVAKWEIKKFDITVTGEGITISSMKDVPFGTEVVVTIVAPNGKELNKLLVDGVEVTVTENTYKFIVKKATTVAVTYTLVEYEIEYILNGGDNYSAAPKTYNVETEYVFGVPVNGNLEFKGWFLDSEFTEEVKGIELGLTGKLVLYAKWGEETTITKVTVYNEAEFITALLNKDIILINLGGDITLKNSLEVNAKKGLTIDGKGFTLDMATVEGWNGNYLIKVWNSTDITIENITLNGGDIGLLVNSSTVTVEKINLTHNEFGGIEVSRSANEELMLPKLTVLDVLSHELVGDIPVVWIDKQDNNEDQLVEFDVGNELLEKAYNEGGKNQYWFYKKAEPQSVVIKYNGNSGNLVDGNNASFFGLDPDIFKISSLKGSHTLHVGVNQGDETIRLYGHKSGDGNQFKVEIAEGLSIKSVKIIFASETTSTRLSLGDEVINLTKAQTGNKTLEYDELDITNFSIKNVLAAEKTVQVRFKSIEITYS